MNCFRLAFIILMIMIVLSLEQTRAYDTIMAKIRDTESKLLSESSKMNDLSSLAIIEDLASAYSSLHMREQSFELYERAFNIRKNLKLSTVTVSVALATELQKMGKYNEALLFVSNEMKKEQVIPDVESILLRQEAHLLDCKGETLLALQKSMKAKNLDGKSGKSGSISDLIQFLRLLRKVLIEEEVTKTIPTAIYDRLKNEWESMKKFLIDSGTFGNPLQMPKSFVRGLRAQPWHSFESPFIPPSFPEFTPLIQLLEESSSYLLKEFLVLETQNLLEREDECIHDSKQGSWKVFMCNAHWYEKVDDKGCSLSTPTACLVMRQAQDILTKMESSSQVLRGGYSAVNGNSHIRAHCGISNAQLKLHVGLFAPIKRDGTPCASLRVANETRSWKTGRVFVFDDSFEHEVWNTCDSNNTLDGNSQRIVFQLVISHPELTRQSSSLEEREEL